MSDENPYVPPAEVIEVHRPKAGRATDADVRTLRWALFGFAIYGSVVPLLCGWLIANKLEFDTFPLIIGLFGFTITKMTYRWQRVPWLAGILLIYPIAFVAGFADGDPKLGEPETWFEPVPSDCFRPRILWIPQVIWAAVIAWLLVRFRRKNYGRTIFELSDA